MNQDPVLDAAENLPGIFTIGHSNHSLDTFLSLLERHAIQVLIDIRSQPFSRYVTHFNYPEVEDAIERRGIQYRYMGQELGGRPQGDSFYDADGYVLYSRVAEAAFFRKGIARLEEDADMYRVAIMCSEEDPTNCHRRLLIGRVLTSDGVQFLHIRGDGRLQTEEDVVVPAPASTQPSLWSETTLDSGKDEQAEWKSIRPVSPRKAPRSSSDPSSDPASDDF
ncbi:MAG TPA: DUF488 domain-containing protein [Ktedonobacterales bacterium]|nr:DUF488 domain-containing protein [Ktedonobacterales bacterium]